MIEWKIGAENNFSVDIGKAGKFMQQYIPASQYEKILSTYADQHADNNWQALLVMTELFSEFANEVAAEMDLCYNSTEENNMMKYLQQLYRNRNNKGK